MNGLEALSKINNSAYSLALHLDFRYELVIIEKELKAFEIIKKSISDKTSLDLLLRQLLCYEKITKDEFDLLKEVLK